MKDQGDAGSIHDGFPIEAADAKCWFSAVREPRIQSLYPALPSEYVLEIINLEIRYFVIAHQSTQLFISDGCCFIFKRKGFSETLS